MKKYKILIMAILIIIILVGMSACSNSSTNNQSNKSSTDSITKLDNNDDKGENFNKNSDSVLSENSSLSKENKETLSQYSSEKIEYARVWLELGPNQEIDELNVWHILAGEPINIYDDTSAAYPKDVISLSGSRSVDGSVTYSSNEDGTINVYNVPSHWVSPAQVDENFMKEYTEDIIKKAKLVSIDLGDEEKIIELINLLNVRN